MGEVLQNCLHLSNLPCTTLTPTDAALATLALYTSLAFPQTPQNSSQPRNVILEDLGTISEMKSHGREGA